MMARFCRYLAKVFDWDEQVETLRDSRPRPLIPTRAAFGSAFMMAATRLRSLNAIESELRVPARWNRIIGPLKPSADSLGRIVAAMDCELLRDLLSHINHRLRRIKALEENPWPLRFVAIDGHEFFSQ